MNMAPQAPGTVDSHLHTRYRKDVWSWHHVAWTLG